MFRVLEHGHIKPECPLLEKLKKKFEKKKKALKAETWSDSETESQ